MDHPGGRPASERFTATGLSAVEFSSAELVRDWAVDGDRVELLFDGALSDVSTSSFCNKKRRGSSH